MDWSIFLFFMKWIFLGLVYLVLLLLIIAVQREMRMRLPQPTPAASGISVGRLRVIQPGSDPRLRPGGIVALEPETSVGSLSDNQLVLRDKFVSGHHARLRWDGVSWWVDDLNSTNGTFVNQQKVVPNAPASLAIGAILEIGDVAFEMMD